MKSRYILLSLIIVIGGLGLYIDYKNDAALNMAREFCKTPDGGTLLNIVIDQAKNERVRIVFHKNGLSSGTISSHDTILPSTAPDGMRLFFPGFFKCNAHCDYTISNNITHSLGASFGCD